MNQNGRPEISAVPTQGFWQPKRDALIMHVCKVWAVEHIPTHVVSQGRKAGPYRQANIECCCEPLRFPHNRGSAMILNTL